jgi:lysozyme family protein
MGSAGTVNDTPTDAVLSPMFTDAVTWVIDVAEGGSRVVNDQGGVTRWGISQKAYPHLNPALLTRREAEELYLRDYWKPVKGNALPPALAFVTFDAAVNLGVRQAVRLLQAVLRVPQDGIMGPETISAAKTALPRHEAVASFLELRLRYYESLAQKSALHLASLYGWRMRVMRLALEAGRWRGL